MRQMRQPKAPSVTELLLTPFPSKEMDLRFLELAEQQLRWEGWKKQHGVHLSQELCVKQRVDISAPFITVAGIQTSVATGVCIALGSAILRPDITKEEWVGFVCGNIIGEVLTSLTGFGLMDTRLTKLLPGFINQEPESER